MGLPQLLAALDVKKRQGEEDNGEEQHGEILHGEFHHSRARRLGSNFNRAAPQSSCAMGSFSRERIF
jgi:hypothetical protein